MAFAIHWKIQFKSLRAGTDYTLNIWQDGYTGSPVMISGSAQPFTTQELGDEDMFTNIRTQSGYLRVYDDGKDANGNSLGDDWWKTFVPAKDTDRPITLTDGNGTVVWQGFMQSQNFSGTLYGNPQEREFPVTCALSALAGEDINFNRGIKNFAFLLKEVCDTIDNDSDSNIHFSTIMVQGGSDARLWLQTKIDWQNFAQEDGEGVQKAKYSLFDVLEDMCRFWGWTARTYGTTLYLTCADDSAEQNFLVLTRSELDTLSVSTTDTTTGSVSAPATVTLEDTTTMPIFASVNNDDTKIQGPHRAVVKSDCNKQDTIIQFAPQDVRSWLGENYTWVQGDDDLVGYFTTPMKRGTENFNLLNLYADSKGGFCRRQIYPSKESDSATVGDMICLMDLPNSPETTPHVQIQTTRPMSYSGGSITLGGTVWRGSEQMSNDRYSIQMRLGIGMTRQTAKWWYMDKTVSGSSIVYGWGNSPSIFNVPINGGSLKSTGFYWFWATLFITQSSYPSIPVPPDTYGYIFIDIISFFDGTNQNYVEDFEIANFSIKYSRDSCEIPTSSNVIRPRTLEVERITSKEYSAVNTNDSKDEWNANCIFASDNNMEYGYGLLLDGSGNIISTVSYGGNAQHPEQHLANRVANYWATAKRKIDSELMSHVTQSISSGGTIAIGNITPNQKVSIHNDNMVFVPIAISRDWRDDIVKLSLLQQS